MHNNENSHTSSDSNTALGSFGDRRFVFISRGKLFLKNGDADVEEVHSPYVQELLDRIERSQQLHGWKKDTAFESSYISDQSNVPSDQHKMRATSAQFTSDGKLLYFLSDNQMGGLFEYDLSDGSEKRLLHKQRLLLEDLGLDQSGEQMICSQYNSNGTANIALMDADGSTYREVTGGDTVDSAPAWVPDAPGKILFQSSGIARNEDGYVIALGPTSIQMLNLDESKLLPVMEEENKDLLQPKAGQSGEIFFIRRPYEPPRYGSANFVADFLMFPFRLLRAIFHYLNFFSLVYSRKPLTSASGPRVQEDLKEMLIKGKRIDAERALKKENRVNGVRSLVPKTWELVKRTRNGEEQVLATNVAAYDITADGMIIYTNGYGVFMLDSSNDTRIVLRGKLIAELVAG